MRETPPIRGNWDHLAAAEVLRTAIVRRTSARSKAAKVCARDYLRCLSLRVMADYDPSSDMSDGESKECLRIAGRIVASVRSLLQ